MERYITDEICNHLEPSNSLELTLAENRLWDMLTEYIPEEQYLKIEEKLYEVFALVEKEFFHYGFTEGIRFIVKNL